MSASPARLLVTGGLGRLALAVVPQLARAGWDAVALGRADLDVTDARAVSEAIDRLRPDVVINLAAWTDVEGCEQEARRAEAVNAVAVGHLRRAIEGTGGHLVHVSSDHVFDGTEASPRVETDATAPVNVYGRTKLASEAEAGPDATVLRLAWLSGRQGRSLASSALRAAADPQRVLRYVTDQAGSPTVAEELGPVLAFVAAERCSGTFHAAGEGVATPYAVARLVLDAAGYDPDRVEPATTDQLVPRQLALRPAYSALDSSALRRAGAPTPGRWEESLARLVGELTGASR
ncbi:MAG: dTDP-4-dehydrorhamnose reductase [Acidimicrobiales bacterium]|nr:dTDP-4-dehydrorhamnose reductase [Acidimicrobiales bacterium]